MQFYPSSKSAHN